MRWFWLLLGFLILAVPAAASVANLRAGRGDLADWIWLILSAGYTAWMCWHLTNLPARRRPVRSVGHVGHQRLDLDEDERDIHPVTQLEQVERILRDDAARGWADLHDVFEEGDR